MKLTDKRGLTIGNIRFSRSGRRMIAIDQHGHTIGIPVDSLTVLADQLVDLVEQLDTWTTT